MYTLMVYDTIEPMRIRFKRNDLKTFFHDLYTHQSSRLSIAVFCGVTVRTLSDWRRGKTTIPLIIFKKLIKKYKLDGNNYRPNVLKDFWHIHKAALKGGLVRYSLHGSPGTPEGRSKGGVATCQKFLLDPTLAKSLNFIVRKDINKPAHSDQLAECIGIILGDGGVTKYQIRITLNNKTDAQYALYIQRVFKNLFGISTSYVEKAAENAGEVIASSRNLVEFLATCDVYGGNKVARQAHVPSWILNNRSYALHCLRGLFDTDGCFYIDRHQYRKKGYAHPGVNFTNRSKPLLDFFFETLQSFSFHPTRNSHYSVVLRREKEVIDFFQKIGTRNPKHRSRFDSFMREYRANP